MKIFASWSGDLSRRVAELFTNWLPDVLQGREVWMSTDLEKGTVWFSEISAGLAATGFGILFVTQDNLNAPWLLFEAGALSKGLVTNRVVPLLIDLKLIDLKPPLQMLNGMVCKRDEIKKLIQQINAASEIPLLDDRLEKAFTRCWPDFEENYNSILASDSKTPRLAPKTTPQLLEEIATNTNIILRHIQSDEQSSLAKEAMQSRIRRQAAINQNYHHEGRLKGRDPRNTLISESFIENAVERLNNGESTEEIKNTLAQEGVSFREIASIMLESRMRAGLPPI